MWEALRQSYGEADLRRRQSDLVANLHAKYSTFDSLERSKKTEAVKDLSLNPYMFKDPFDGLSNNLYRWTQQAGRFQNNSPEEKAAIASKWYDEQIAPFYAASGLEGATKRQWMENAWGRAMNFDPAQNYRNPVLHGIISGFESAEAQVGRAGQTLLSAFGVPLRAWTEGLTNPSHGVLAGWHNLAMNIHNRPAGTSALGAVLSYGEGAPAIGHWAKFDKDAADYFSFWHDITPNRTWTEKATSFVVDNALQLPLYMAGGEIAKLGVGAVTTMGEGLPFIGNLTQALGATKTGQYASKLLLLGTEGLVYGGATREVEDKSNSWKDALNFMAMGTLMSWAGKGAGKLKDLLPKDSPEAKSFDAVEQKAALGMKGLRAATPEEDLAQHRQHIAGVAAAGGMGAVSSVFEEALAHVRTSETEGWTPEKWTSFKQAMSGKDKVRYDTVFAVTEMMRTWLKEQGLTIKQIDEALASGERGHYEAFTSFLKNQVQQAVDEMGIHVPPMTESEAQERAETYTRSSQGQAKIKALIGQGLKPEEAEARVRAEAQKQQQDFVNKANESRTETGPQNQARKAQEQKLPPGVKSLPDALKGSKPRYSYGPGNNFEIQFEDPRDLAAYVISGKGRSAAHEQFMDYYREHHPDASGTSLKAHGDRIRAALKEQAKNFTGDQRVLKLKSMAEIPRAVHEPLLKRVGRYIYDKAGKAVGYSMSVGFDWTVAKENAAKAKGWKGKGPADNAFWKDFANFHDDADTDNPEGFVEDLKKYFNPVKHKGLQFERAGTSDYTNFLGFMYHFRDKLPDPVADKLQDILLNSKKMQEILNTRRITEDQLDHFGQAMVNHVEMFTRTKWFNEKGERHVFRSTQPAIGEKTKWQRDLLEDMQKRELGQASSFFPGRSKAAAGARDAYKAALAILHADETEAFNAKYPKDKASEARLTASMERTKELARRAAQDRLSSNTLAKLMAEHKDLMSRLGGSGSEDISQVVHSIMNPEYHKYADVLKKHEETKARLDAEMEAADRRGKEAFQRQLDTNYGTPERAAADQAKAQSRVDWQKAFTERFQGAGKATPEVIEAMTKGGDPTYGRISKDYAGRTTVWLSRELTNAFHRGTSPLQFFSTLHGQNIGKADIDKKLNLLKVFLGGDANKKYREALTDLLTRAKDMAGSQGVMLATLEGKGPKDWLSQRETFREEWTHGWQRALLGDYVDDATFVDKHLRKDVSDYLYSKIPDGMRQYLDTHYKGKSPALHVIEAGAKLISQHPKKFGLSYDQAADWLLEYTNAVTDKYGNDAFKHLTTAIGIAKEIKSIYANL